ncbi:MAG: argininosuccinate lyase [Dissulfurimicrobium sp.]|uniref:argininosuccinate lyase n=1 Tax=Dissulfurimicrobium sp. TaxID=2022436 RepID=UPI00404964AE
MTDSEKNIKKLWGGRFAEDTDKLVEQFTASVQFDKRLYRQDIAGSKAHATMLARQGIISPEEGRAIVKGLDRILEDIENGKFVWQEALEDVHMNIEQSLVERIGDAGKKLHTARSRNDQIATDLRLYLRDETDRINGLLQGLQLALLSQAKRHSDLIMPGYTHLQRAQPVLWAHHMLAYFEMFKRDRWRLMDGRRRINICPLGSAALAGTSLPIDREFTSKELGFDSISANSMDAVADRDFVVEFLAALSLIMAHLSRLSEELILWSTVEFGFVELPDAFCTGSSIMPQKKNPDVPELIRGKTGRVYGHLMAMLTIIKALPMTYNRDLQEDKEALFDAIDTTSASLEIMTAIVARMEPKKERIRDVLDRGFLTATDLADYLVRKDLPFRKAHEVAGKIVARCIETGKEIRELSLDELKAFSPLIEEDIYAVLTIEGSLMSRRSAGGTAPEAVAEAIKLAEMEIEMENFK